MELLETDQSCKLAADGGADLQATPLAFWSRTQSECEPGSYWVVANSMPGPDLVEQPRISCKHRSLEEASARCCADTTLVDCKLDWYNWTIDDGDGGSWNWTQTPIEDDFNIDVGKAVGSGAGVAAWCLCSLWTCYLSRGWIKKGAKTLKASRATKMVQKNLEQIRQLARNPALAGDIEEQKGLVLSRTHSGYMAARQQGLTSTPRPSPAHMARRKTKAGWPKGLSLTSMPDPVKIRVLGFFGDCRSLARLSRVCAWWNDLKFQAATHLNIEWGQLQGVGCNAACEYLVTLCCFS